MNLKDQRQIIALILVGVGVLWLLVSLNVVAGAFIWVVLRYWPVLLIGIGLDILVRQRPLLGLPYTALAFATLLIFSLVSSPGGLAGSARLEQSLTEPLGAAREVKVKLELSGAPVSVTTLDGGDDLLRAAIRDSGDVRLEARGRTSKTLHLEKRSRSPRFGDVNNHWNIALTERIPVELEVSASSGPLEMDLAGLNLRELSLDLGSGSSALMLPTTAASYQVELEGGSGSSEVRVAEGAQLAIEADLGSGATRFVFGEDSYVELELSGGSGPVILETPEGANVKVEVQDGGSGGLNLPAWLKRVDTSDDDEGVWQTEGFDPNAAQIIVTIEDAGSGTITVR